MKFLAPQAFALLAVLPIVVLFYLLKRRRVVHLVSSTLLWQKFLAETQASAPFQKLRHNWLLIIQLILLAIAIFALSRPYWPTEATESRFRVIILDGSASMRSTDVVPSRFEHARKEALKWLDSLRDNDQMMVLLAGARTEVKQSATGDKAALRRALESSQPSDAPTRLSEAFKLAETLTKGREDAEIHLFSDGALPNVENISNESVTIIYHKIGERAQNVGIVKMDIKPNPENPRQRAIFASVGNYGTNQVQNELDLYFEGTLVESRPIELKSRETGSQVFLVEQNRDGVYSLKLKGEDDLQSDNVASVFSRMPTPVRVLYVTETPNRFVERALRAVPQVELTTANDITGPVLDQDVVVLNRVIPSLWPEKNMLAFDAANTNWFPEVVSLKDPTIVYWNTTHPVLRFVNLDNVSVFEARGARNLDWGSRLVDSTEAGLIVGGERGRQRLLWVGFDTMQSDWVLRISFPIFIANAIEWLNPANAVSTMTTIKAGDSFRFNLQADVASYQVKFPDGKTESFAVDGKSAAEIVFGQTDRQGVYQMKAGTNQVTFCVNVTNSGESDVTPRDELPFSGAAKVQASTMKRANLELWRWIALVALLVLLFEWWYYHRRTA